MDIITIFCEKCPDIFHDINHEHCIKCETHHSLIGKKYYCTDCNKCYQTKLIFSFLAEVRVASTDPMLWNDFSM